MTTILTPQEIDKRIAEAARVTVDNPIFAELMGFYSQALLTAQQLGLWLDEAWGITRADVLPEDAVDWLCPDWRKIDLSKLREERDA